MGEKFNMEDTRENVIEMPQINEERDCSKFITIGYEIVSMIFETLISFVPIILYWLIFYFSNTKVDYYEHIKNGSIIWIFLAMLVAGNFKIIVDSQHKRGIGQRLIIACMIFLC